MARKESQIAYHDYLALVCSFDDSAWVRMGNATLNLVPNQFTNLCHKYFINLEEARLAWIANNGEGTGTEPFASYLYNPACFLTFGHADSVGLVLIDEIEAMMAITSHSTSPVEQANLSYCPKLSSLGIGADGIFVDPHLLFDAKRHNPNECPQRRSHSIEQTAPLFHWARLKLNGFAVLGYGLLIQQCAYRTIAKKIEEIQALLLKGKGAPLIEPEDVSPDRLKITFLDPQGSEDLAILIFSKNYSVGITILSAIRALTFGDLFSEDTLIPSILERSKAHKLLTLTGKKKTSSVKAGLENNHIISKTYTTLGVSYSAFWDIKKPACNGYVSAFPNLDINPGHLASVEATLFKANVGKNVSTQNLGRADSIHRFLVGRQDYLVELKADLGSEMVTGLSILDFFELMRGVYHQFDCPNAKGETETGLLDISTSLVIPFPKIVTNAGVELIPPKISDNHLSIMPLLLALRKSTFEGPADKSPGADPILCIRKLEESLNRLLLPRSLRRATHYLFQIYAHCLSDPFLFDCVLDLHDSFAALHHFLCRVTPDQERKGYYREGLNLNDIGQVEKFLEALHGALTHRVAISLPNWENRDIAIDFRGGLNRLLAAADVPLKCGLGLLRRQSPPNERSLFNQVGAVTRVTLNPSPVIYSIEKAEKLGLHLAYLEMDASQILDPFEYSIHIHEVAHLIIRNIGSWSEYISIEVDLASPKSLDTADRCAQIGLEEVAVEMLTFLFLFEPSVDLFRRRLVIRYNSCPLNTGLRYSVVVRRFGEILLRLFFVTDPYNKLIESGADIRSPDSLLIKYSDSAEAAWSRFESMMFEVGPIFQEFKECKWAGAPFIELVQDFRKMFFDAYEKYAMSVGRIWKAILRVYQNSCVQSGLYPWSKGRAEDFVKIENEVELAFEMGRPLQVGFLRHSLAEESNLNLDDFYIVSRLLRTYFRRLIGKIEFSSEMHKSPMDYTSAKIGRENKKISPAFLDPFNAGLTLVSPKDRRDRIRWQISVLKTMWDQSTYLRSRRLTDLLSNNHPNLNSGSD